MKNIKFDILFVVFALVLAPALRGQELGFAAYTFDLGEMKESGFYGGYDPIVGDVPDTEHGWTHLIAVRHQNPTNNFQMQLASSYAVNDRLFFRKITASDTQNPPWYEVATRHSNSFVGDQLIQGKIGIGTSTPVEALDFGGRGKNLRFHYAHLGETESAAGTVLGNNLRALSAAYDRLEISSNYTDAAHAIYMKYNSGWHFVSVPQGHGLPVGTLVEAPTNTKVHITTSGNVGVGVNNPQNKLDVNGTIRAKEVIVESGWADHVFADGYALLPLAEVEAHIAAKRRLPGVPSAEEVADSGVSLGESQRILLEKVEELTLYLIEMRKDQQAREAELRAEIATLREELDRRSL